MDKAGTTHDQLLKLLHPIQTQYFDPTWMANYYRTPCRSRRYFPEAQVFQFKEQEEGSKRTTIRSIQPRTHPDERQPFEERDRTIRGGCTESHLRSLRLRHPCGDCGVRIWEQIWVGNPDEEMKEENEAHLAFIEALQEVWDLLGGAIWRKECPDGKKLKHMREEARI